MEDILMLLEKNQADAIKNTLRNTMLSTNAIAERFEVSEEEVIDILNSI